MLHKYINKGLVHGLHRCKRLLPTHVDVWVDVVYYLWNYRGLTFTASLWKAEQAFAMSYKPQSKMARNLFAGWTVQICSLKKPTDRWAVLWDRRRKAWCCGTFVCRRFTANLQFGAFCWKLTMHYIVFIKGHYCRRRVGVNSRYYFWKIILRVEEVVQWMLYAGFPNLH